MPRRIRTLLLALVVIFVLAILSLIVFTPGRPPALPPLPNPNGYNDFVKASEVVTGNVSDFRELSLRCYQSEQRHPPARLDELVPNCLSKMPADPFNGQPLIYRLQGTNWLLYSVGPDGADDGGRAAGRGWPVKGDILFDSSW